VKQLVGDRGDDPAPGLAAPDTDPGLGALGEDRLGVRLLDQFRLRHVEIGPHQFLLAGVADVAPRGAKPNILVVLLACHAAIATAVETSLPMSAARE
jgi:hypothetical protein